MEDGGAPRTTLLVNLRPRRYGCRTAENKGGPDREWSREERPIHACFLPCPAVAQMIGRDREKDRDADLNTSTICPLVEK
jgi:hypothetical protein